MNLNSELLEELNKQLSQAEKTFKENVDKLENKELKIDMLNSFAEIKAGNLDMNELTKKTKQWLSNSDK